MVGLGQRVSKSGATTLAALVAVAPGALGFVVWVGALSRLGMVAATTLVVVEAVVALARAAIPVSTIAWAAGRQPQSAEPIGAQRRRKLGVLGVELALAAAVAVVLVASARWWASALQLSPVPWWLVAAVSARGAGRHALSTSAVLACRGVLPVAALLAILDMMFVLGLAAMIRAELGFVAVGTAAVTLSLAVVAVVVTQGPPSAAMRVRLPSAVVTSPGRSVVTLLIWSTRVLAALPPLYLVLLAGPALLPPYMVASYVVGLLLLPLLLVALVDEPGLARRLARGVALAGVYGLVCHQLGPPLVRWLVPAALAGQAELLRTAAWGGLSLIPASLWRAGRRTQAPWRRAVAGVVGLVAMLVLGPRLGLPGLVWAANMTVVTLAVLGIVERPGPGATDATADQRT